MNLSATEKARRYREAHPERVQESLRRYAEAHPERIREATRRYDEQHRDKRNAYARDHRAERTAYRREWVRRNAERLKEARRRYRAANPHIDAGVNHRRRASRRAAGVFVVDLRRVFARARGHCFYCGAKAKLTIDHVLPLKRGGRHSEGNVVAACASCNYSKGGLLLAEWKHR